MSEVSQNLIQQFQSYLQVLIDSPDESLVSEALLKIRQATSVETNPPLQELIDVGLVELLIRLGFKRSLSVEDQSNILWTLTNVCSGNSTQTNYVIENNGLDLFIRSCDSPHATIVSQSFWGIGNIAGDSTKDRDVLLNLGVVPLICKSLQKENFLSSKDQATALWVLSNLARGKPLAEHDKVKEMIPLLLKAIAHPQPDVKIDALWGLSYLSEHDQSHSTFISNNIGSYINQLIPDQTQEKSLLVPAMRIIGNLASGADTAVNYIIDQNLILWMISVMNIHAQSQALVREGFWSLSNIAAGTPDQQLHLINQPEFRTLVEWYITKQPTTQALQTYTELYFILGNLTTSTIACEKMLMNEWHTLWINNKVMLKENNVKMEVVFFEGLANLTKKPEIFSAYQLQQISTLIVQITGENAKKFAYRVADNLQLKIPSNETKMDVEAANNEEQEISEEDDQSQGNDQDSQDSNAIVIEGIKNLNINNVQNTSAGAGAEKEED